MSERLNTTSPEVHMPTVETTAERPKAAEFSASDRAHEIQKARAVVAAETRKSERPVIPTVEPVDDRPQLIDNVAKRFRMKQNLTQVQSRLKPAEKRFSKVVHQPLVQRVSETASHTITRPSGMLGGGLLAFVGSVVYLYLTKNVGVTYNFSVFLILFFGGFTLGVAIEYAAFWLRRVRSR